MGSVVISINGNVIDTDKKGSNSSTLECLQQQQVRALSSVGTSARPSEGSATTSVPTASQRCSSQSWIPNHVDFDGLATSRLGLDPVTNRFHAPLVYHENYSFADWPPNHTFPMDKFHRIAHALMSTSFKTVATSTLPRPLVRQEDHFFRTLNFNDVPREWFDIIDEDFVDRFLDSKLSVQEARYIGFRDQAGRPELIERTVLEVAGTILTAQLACKHGIAGNVAGGTHHAHPAGGAGYTILNDFAVATNFLINADLHRGSVPHIDRVLVVDCDVHQGDGTAKFSTQWKDGDDDALKDRLFTLSMHCASNYPRLKAHSTYDIGLHDGCTDDEYMEALTTNVERAITEVRPDFVFYDAGVDVYEHDKLGRLKVSESGIRQRDRWVLDRCVSSGIPVAAVVGGGYDKDVDALARRHAIVHEECSYVWRKHQMWKREVS
eukprot:CAMPEP_0198124410 /NCGR_PEP_ID=MMETSP1442-20131203/39831_1 /TAXON_ID= /ORGANISM="Craspedostauros australis, Strain CCMP3328" /LENGTH=435 /DNA_ID=CAMNT_0043783795 /DNA_START=416 /DNA_END=1724 /DNA_ORIENTATION=+